MTNLSCVKDIHEDFVWLNKFVACLFCGGYFPIQNLEKIFPNKSSVEISPVIIPK